MDRHRFIRCAALALFAILVLAVRPSAAQTAGPAPATPAQVSLEDVRSLRWLEGNWRGAASGEQPFYEGYRFVNDSTLVMSYYSDSTFTHTTGTGTVEFRGGRIYHQSGSARWVVTHLDGAELRFAPVRARNSFVWKKESQNAWTASLSFPGRAPVVYHLTRIPR